MALSTGRALVAAVAAATIWIAAVPRVGSAQATPDLTGTWVVNPELSDRPGQSGGGDSGDTAGRRRPGGGGMGRPGGMSGMGRRGGFGDGGMPNPEDMERMRAAMDAATRVPTRLIIVKSETGLIVTDEEGVSTRLPLDGRKDTGAVNGVPFETATRWDAGKLRVERKFKGGVKVVELYSLTADPRLLTVSSTVEGGRMRDGGRTTTRVYDAREPAGDGR